MKKKNTVTMQKVSRINGDEFYHIYVNGKYISCEMSEEKANDEFKRILAFIKKNGAVEKEETIIKKTI